MRVTKIVPWVLGIGTALFVAALAGAGSGLVTRERPTTTTTATTTATTTTTAPGTTGATTTAAATTTVAAGPTITISGFAFGDPITVAAGTTVTVVNADATGHTWTSQAGVFDSGTLRGGDTFTFTFTDAGEYRFFCGIHPSMTGSITITG